MYEGFGLPPLEAISCGCPVIVSNNSSLPEVVGEAGIMIDYDSDEQHIKAYESYYFNENLRKENSQKGLERAKLFSWEKCVDAMVDFIKANIDKKDSLALTNEIYLEVNDKNLRRKHFKPKNNKILLINHTNFFKNNAGNNVYLFNIVKVLKNMGYSIDFLSSEKFIANDYKDFEILNKQYKAIDNFYLAKFERNDDKYPYSATSWADKNLINLFQRAILENNYSYIFSNYINFSDLFRFSDVPNDIKIINIFHDFHTMQRFFTNNNFDEIPKQFESEVKLLQFYDDVLCISYDEKYIFEKFYPNKRFYWLPFFADKNPSANLQNKDIDLLFVGFSNVFNRDSIIWFYENIYKHCEGANLSICGKVCAMLEKDNPKLYQKMFNDNIKFYDFVDDLSTMYKRTKIAIVPMLGGTGLKVKTVEAMSYSLPVVGTISACDGFMDKCENGCLLSDDPLIFASNIKKLLNDEKFYYEISDKISRYFDKNFSQSKAENTLKKVLNG